MFRPISKDLIWELFSNFEKTYGIDIPIRVWDGFWDDVIIAYSFLGKQIEGHVKYHYWPVEGAYQIWFKVDDVYYSTWYYYTIAFPTWRVQQMGLNEFENPIRRD